MGVVRTNWQLGATDLQIAFMQSQLVRLRQSWQHDSLTGDQINFSCDGYGRPAAVFVRYASIANTIFQIIVSISVTGSIFRASVQTASGDLALMSLGSLAVTVTLPYEILALIGSR